eukprot:1177782-Prorocentrum_minimum.AAC.2
MTLECALLALEVHAEEAHGGFQLGPAEGGRAAGAVQVARQRLRDFVLALPPVGALLLGGRSVASRERGGERLRLLALVLFAPASGSNRLALIDSVQAALGKA